MNLDDVTRITAPVASPHERQRAAQAALALINEGLIELAKLGFAFELSPLRSPHVEFPKMLYHSDRLVHAIAADGNEEAALRGQGFGDEPLTASGTAVVLTSERERV